MAVCLDKGLTKEILQTLQIPTPDFLVLEPETLIDLKKFSQIGYPLFLKPLYEGASKGVDENAIINTSKALLARIKWLWNEYKQPVLLEK